MKKLSFFILFFIFTLALGNPALARSGCCSWHGGVCGCDSSVGRQVCCDGSYSPSCTCAYNPPVYRLPTPTPILIPESIKGGPNYRYDDKTQLYDVTFDWDNWSQSSGWSIGLSTYAGSDPGPLIDTTSSVWTFNNVYPGEKYVNIKASVNGHWSRISYWMIEVPPIPTATLTPTDTPTPTVMPTQEPANEEAEIKLTEKSIETIPTPVQKESFWRQLFRFLLGF